MALYDFKCKTCDGIALNIVLPMTHTSGERPQCCGSPMAVYITQAPTVHWVHPTFEACRMPGIPGAPVVSTHREREELMKRHDMVDANDMPPPTHAEQAETHRQVQESIDKISVPDDVARELDIV